MIPGHRAPGAGALAKQLGGAFTTLGALIGTAFLATVASYGTWAWLTSDFDRGREVPRAESVGHAAIVEEASRERRSESSHRRARFAMVGGLTLNVLVFASVLSVIVRQRRALSDSIVKPITALLGHIARIRDGQLEPSVDPAGPLEIRQLAEGLNEMVRALSTARSAAALRDEALRDHALRLRQILDASRDFSESLNLAYVLGAVRESTASIGRYDGVFVWLTDEEANQLVESDPCPASDPPTPASEPLQRRLAGRAAKAGRITFEDASGQLFFSEGRSGRVRAIAVPLIVATRVVGALEVRNSEAREATNEMIDVLETLATHAATAIESARLHAIVEQRSRVDALTRLLNRRRLDEDLDTECNRCLRYGRPLAFVMVDVDHFKAFNDSWGHPRGDRALKEVANVIASCMRATDTAYRYGGEEFCVILRETSGLDAMHFAERVRQCIELRFSNLAEGLTASLGVADFSPDTPTPAELVEAADTAMYESKNAGRNRVALSSRPRFTPRLELVAPRSV